MEGNLSEQLDASLVIAKTSTEGNGRCTGNKREEQYLEENKENEEMERARETKTTTASAATGSQDRTAPAPAPAPGRVPILLCDAGYKLPRESRPRKEKVQAIARQLVNFLQWQQHMISSDDDSKIPSKVQVVGCTDEETKVLLENRTREVWTQHQKQQTQQKSSSSSKVASATKESTSSLPPNVSFSCEPLEVVANHKLQNKPIDGENESLNLSTINEVVYLSPDADVSLDPAKEPPPFVVVGLLIDRRVQPNRSKQRAELLQVTPKRWPLDECFDISTISPNEPLNVDCIMEGMQQWWWNCSGKSVFKKEYFVQAAEQAIQHHAQRHPSRPVHLKS